MAKQNKTQFWNFSKTGEEYILRINGYIAEESWFMDDVTPKLFRKELNDCSGKVTVWVNSAGGDCFAASQIYTMLKEYDGEVVMKVDGIAASAASVILMAGDRVEMSPTSLIMIHNPATMIFGETQDLEQGIEMLNEVKESIINAYQQRTKMPRAKLSKLMDAETWMNANKAVELGFADEVLYNGEEEDKVETTAYMFNSSTMVMSAVNAMRKKLPKKEQAQVTEEKSKGTDISILETRLNLIK